MTSGILSSTPAHPSQDDIRRSGIRVDEDVLDKLTGQLQGLQRTREQIIAAIAQSQAALDAVEYEMQDTMKRHADLQYTIRRKRALLVPRPFMELPMDLLHCIFEHLAVSHMVDGEWIEVVPLGKRKLNRDRVLCAYWMASVCRHWRTAALSLPTLWSYIGVSCYSNSSNVNMKGIVAAKWSRLVAGVRTLVDRSKAAPLDIFLDWSNTDEFSGGHYEAILDKLGEHTTRWRSFELRCIRVGVPLHWLDVFRSPTPMLEELSILSQQDADMTWKTPYPRYLPVAPRLHSLYLEHCPLISTTGLPSLVVLDIWLTTLPTERAWDIMLGCPSLQSLLLGCKPLDLHSTPPNGGTISLPSLQTLEMHGFVEPLFVSHGQRLELPNLNELCLFGHMVEPLRSFFEQACTGVQSLVIFTGDLDATSANSLQTLSRLQSAKFIECTISSEFIGALARSENPMWPDLRRIELEKVEKVEGPQNTDMDCFVRMLRARNPERGTQDEEDSVPRPHPIQEFLFDEMSLNKWVASEIRYIMELSAPRQD